MRQYLSVSITQEQYMDFMLGAESDDMRIISDGSAYLLEPDAKLTGAQDVPDWVSEWCSANQHIEPELVNDQWRAFPINGVMSVPVPTLDVLQWQHDRAHSYQEEVFGSMLREHPTQSLPASFEPGFVDSDFFWEPSDLTLRPWRNFLSELTANERWRSDPMRLMRFFPKFPSVAIALNLIQDLTIDWVRSRFPSAFPGDIGQSEQSDRVPDWLR
jgi:hypothetical protein